MRTRAIALFASLILVSSAPSAFADDGGEADEGTSKASRMKIELIADFVAGDDASFDGAATSVTDMRTTGIGWGALFKIYKLAAAMAVDPSTLVGEIGPDGEFEFSFGELKKALTDEERARFDELPKNFGTLMASGMRADKATDKASDKASDRAAARVERKAERDARKEGRDAAKADREGDDDDADLDDDVEDDEPSEG